jgi:hypothetical protein
VQTERNKDDKSEERSNLKLIVFSLSDILYLCCFRLISRFERKDMDHRNRKIAYIYKIGE